jgi:hypothetical protein
VKVIIGALSRVGVARKAIVKVAWISIVALTIDTVQVVWDITVTKTVVIATPNLYATVSSAKRRFVVPVVWLTL